MQLHKEATKVADFDIIMDNEKEKFD